MIKNHTIYEGRPFLKLEKYPHYTGGTPYSKLNKIHLNLGFIKLVSRVPMERYNPQIVEQIKNHNGIRIKTVKYTQDFTPLYELDHPEITIGQGVMNQVHNVSGKYIGDLERGYWLVKNGIIPDGEIPYVGYIPSKDAWIGWTHRGHAYFKIGDKLFDPEWRPRRPFDYGQYFQDDFMKEPEHVQIRLLENIDELKEYATDRIPFYQRGEKVIEDRLEAREAARRLSDYLG